MTNKAAAPAVEDDNPEGLPRFVSTTGEAVLLATTRGGHTCAVQTLEQSAGKGTPLHPRFHRIAVLKGCMPVGMHTSTVHEETQRPEADREQLLLKTIADMVAEAADDAQKQQALFTGDGRPDARQMTIRLGFPVGAAERDRAWDQYIADNDVASADPD
jgi:hypothetical protein